MPSSREGVFSEGPSHPYPSSTSAKEARGRRGREAAVEMSAEERAEGRLGEEAESPLKAVFERAAEAQSPVAEATSPLKDIFERAKQLPPVDQGSPSEKSRVKELFEEGERALKQKAAGSSSPSPKVKSNRPSSPTTSPATGKSRNEQLFEEAKLREQRLKQVEAEKKRDPEATFTPEISKRAEKYALPGGATARSEKLFEDARLRAERRAALVREAEPSSEYRSHPNHHTPRPKPVEPRPLTSRRSPSPTQPRPIGTGTPDSKPSTQQRRSSSPTLPRPTTTPDVVSRLLSAEQARTENLTRLREEQLQKEQLEYTFTPRSTRPLSPKPRQSSPGEDTWIRLSKTGIKNFRSPEIEKQSPETRDCTFRPVVGNTPPTAAIVIPARKDVHSRLYNDAIQRRTKQEPVANPTPGVRATRGSTPPQLVRPAASSQPIQRNSISDTISSPQPSVTGTRSTLRAPSPSGKVAFGSSSPRPLNITPSENQYISPGASQASLPQTISPGQSKTDTKSRASPLPTAGPTVSSPSLRRASPIPFSVNSNVVRLAGSPPKASTPVRNATSSITSLPQPASPKIESAPTRRGQSPVNGKPSNRAVSPTRISPSRAPSERQPFSGSSAFKPTAPHSDSNQSVKRPLSPRAKLISEDPVQSQPLAPQVKDITVDNPVRTIRGKGSATADTQSLQQDLPASSPRLGKIESTRSALDITSSKEGNNSEPDQSEQMRPTATPVKGDDHITEALAAQIEGSLSLGAVRAMTPPLLDFGNETKETATADTTGVLNDDQPRASTPPLLDFNDSVYSELAVMSSPHQAHESDPAVPVTGDVPEKDGTNVHLLE